MVIREIEPNAEVAEIHNLWVEFVEEVGEYNKLSTIKDEYHAVVGDKLHKWLEDDERVIFAYFEDRPVGFVAAHYTNNDDSHYIFKESRIVRIDAIYIEDESRGEGHGQLLIDRIEEWAKNEIKADQITLTVECDNQQAQKFWRNLNYQPTIEKRVKNI